MSLKLPSYLLPKFCRVPFTIVLILLISFMVNGTLLNFGKRYVDDLRVIFDQWPKMQLAGCAKQSKNLKWYLNYTLAAFLESIALLTLTTTVH